MSMGVERIRFNFDRQVLSRLHVSGPLLFLTHKQCVVETGQNLSALETGQLSAAVSETGQMSAVGTRQNLMLKSQVRG